jgi:2-polyprenyl-3-methyl-5-hydroxy-6-metoxy-1,4-benzoquinol methylase
VPTVEENLKVWGLEYDWTQRGEEWSATWGGSDAQWFGAIFPRIHAFLPAGTVLEIAPGFGRWTHYLRDWCERLIVVDLAENCISYCQRRFASDSRITYHVNDGRSLAMVPDGSIDFVFSFDSLVHVDIDVLQAYLDQLARKLSPNGVGFIHHSNIGQHRRFFAASQRLPRWVGDRLRSRGFLDQTHSRSLTVTARLFDTACDQAGLQCIGQELVNWGTRRLIDCFSLFTPKTSTWARPNQIVANPGFMNEAEAVRRVSHLYAASHFRRAERATL